LLVEANPLNIRDLMECWKDYPQVEIYNIAIVPVRHKAPGVFIFYYEKDSPNYQTTSVFPEHLYKHYGKDVDLNKFFVGAMNINDFNTAFLNNTDLISLYSIDIEGLDADITLDVNFSLINCEYYSLEYISLGTQEKDVLNKLRENNYIFDGRGVDISGYDWLFKKVRD
jgi:hypothetical protein